ncbi:hypothetical protein CBR_g19344 [Chara braunii]|uniref:Abl-interactor homeo-domain homologous domain-containing protein n=1 Tax=Chara braunii TaxID=69332 RepID=A0A388KXX5_CHABU|nr:hypothetical protein CBR_g19344 [Chara braunii]|eukprot:GBG74832.1 hypothetical protein CBR_g19344 [Chara braunii]
MESMPAEEASEGTITEFEATAAEEGRGGGVGGAGGVGGGGGSCSSGKDGDSLLISMQELRSLRPQLQAAAEYCKSTYAHGDQEQKELVMQNLKAYVVKALVNAVDQLGTVAYKLNNELLKQSIRINESEVHVAALAQRLNTCNQYLEHDSLKQQQELKPTSRFHKSYVTEDKLADVAQLVVESRPEMERENFDFINPAHGASSAESGHFPPPPRQQHHRPSSTSSAATASAAASAAAAAAAPGAALSPPLSSSTRGGRDTFGGKVVLSDVLQRQVSGWELPPPKPYSSRVRTTDVLHGGQQGRHGANTCAVGVRGEPFARWTGLQTPTLSIASMSLSIRDERRAGVGGLGGRLPSAVDSGLLPASLNNSVECWKAGGSADGSGRGGVGRVDLSGVAGGSVGGFSGMVGGGGGGMRRGDRWEPSDGWGEGSSSSIAPSTGDHLSGKPSSSSSRTKWSLKSILGKKKSGKGS